MKIAYISHSRFPTEKAHGKQIAEVCSALSELGHEVTLICPRLKNNIFESAFEYYNIPDNYDVRFLHHFDGTTHFWVPGILRFAITMFFYKRALKRFLSLHKFDLLYARSSLLLPQLVESNIPVIAELHIIPNRFLNRFVFALNKCVLVVSLTTPMRDALISLGVDKEKVIVEGDGVLLNRFTALENAQSIREYYGLPKNKKILGYVGSLVTRNTIEKGVIEILEAISVLEKQGMAICGFIVGGPKDWKLKYMKHARSLGLSDENVIFADRVPVSKVSSLLHACDVLVYPAPASLHPYFMRDTSPLKMFEYLASGKEIVCADIPPLRDVVSEESVSLFSPGDSTGMASAISKVFFQDISVSDSKKKKRAELAKWYNWKNRMERIISRAET
ncbi:MAG: glycosyltransferase [Candidatus Peribacteraceae bacterium]|nr:glycosyltransferase [Candidatus Peribacteraceae bacterium]